MKIKRKERLASWRMAGKMAHRQGSELVLMKRLFLRMFSGASVADLCCIANFQLLRDQILGFDRDARAVVLSGHVTPWPIVWVLARYNRKHIWCPNRLPDLTNIRGHVDDFCNKVKWRWIFRNEPAEHMPFRIKHSRTTACTSLTNPELECWLQGLKKTIYSSFKTSFSKHRHGQYHGNQLPVVRWGLRMLKDKCLGAIPADKRGGYVVTSMNNVIRIHEDILQSNLYEEISPSSINAKLLYSHYFSLRSRICKMQEFESCKPMLLKSVRGKGRRIPCMLAVTCKTHKPAGEVSFRNLHAGATNAFMGLSAWVAHVCEDYLRSCTYILQSTEEFVQRLDAIRIDPGDILVRIDVEHFYMSGTHDELVSAILMAFQRPLLRQRLKEAVYFLLAHQYIESKLLPGRCWVTKIGSGMGLRHSGAIADLAFAMLAELPWALKPYNLSAYGIKTYMRFKDDIFVVANDKIKLREWYWRLRDGATCFKTIVEQYSLSCVSMLQVTVSVEGSRLVARPKFKEMSLEVPLCTSSAHARHVHRWPCSFIRNLGLISTDYRDALKAK